ncbi:acyltransferase family protein [Streptomyces sp. NPDC050516]|uniref:acyltransferase family protein n=1 Tax=Streptomyces sp. NPDC050516 TaxID=3365621 RepID=UPI0037AD6A60
MTEIAGRSATAPVRLDSLTGLRWWAALLVFFLHFSYENDFFGYAEQVSLLQHMFYGSPSAVSFFFILSGFVLAWSSRPGDPAGRFWARRFFRIYPSHLVTFIAAAAMLIWTGSSLDWKIALSNLTLTQSWIPNGRDYWFGFNGVSWSLCVEFFFYFTFPFITPFIRKMSVPGWRLTAAISCLFVIILPLFSDSAQNVLGWRPSTLVYMFPAPRLAEFILGICLAFLVKNHKWRGPGLLVSIALCLCSMFWLVHQLPDPMHYSACTVIPYALLVCAAEQADVRGTKSVFRSRRMVYLGEISFAFYLVHELVVFSANHGMRNNHNISTASNIVATFSVSLVAAMVLHEYVEKPAARVFSPAARKPLTGASKS